MKVFRKIQKYVSVALLFALILLMYNNFANQHRHLLSNGQIVVHAHPFSKKNDNLPEKKHTHNSNELFVISQINNLFSFILLVAFVFKFITKTSFKRAFVSKNETYFSFCYSNIQSRDPPLN